jgi:hypothetical protein
VLSLHDLCIVVGLLFFGPCIKGPTPYLVVVVIIKNNHINSNGEYTIFKNIIVKYIQFAKFHLLSIMEMLQVIVFLGMFLFNLSNHDILQLKNPFSSIIIKFSLLS